MAFPRKLRTKAGWIEYQLVIRKDGMYNAYADVPNMGRFGGVGETRSEAIDLLQDAVDFEVEALTWS